MWAVLIIFGIIVFTVLFIRYVLKLWSSPLINDNDARLRDMLASEHYSLYDTILDQVFRFRGMKHIGKWNEEILEKINKWSSGHCDTKQNRYAQAFLREVEKWNVGGGRVRAQGEMPFFIPFLSNPQTFVLTDIALARWCLSDVETFDRARTLRTFADIFNLDNVFTTEDSRLHDKLRNFFLKEIKVPTMGDMDIILDKHITEMLANQQSGTSTWQVVPEIEAMVLKAYAELFFGISNFPHAHECCLLIKRIWQIKSLRGNITACKYNPFLYIELKKLQRRLNSYTNAVYRANPNELAKSPDTVFGRLYALYDNPIQSRSENIWNVLIPLFETLSRTLLCALIELAHAEEVQAHLYEEISRENAIRGSFESYCGDAETTLLQRVWQETLRMLPPTANQTRIVVQPNPLFPVGSKVSVSWNFFQMDPDVWGSDAGEFKPDRWINQTHFFDGMDTDDDENQRIVTEQQMRHFNPFSIGSQSCIGKHYASLGGRIMLKRILEKVKLTPGQSSIPVIIDRAFSRGPDIATTLILSPRTT